MIISIPKTHIMDVTGIASRRIGGFSGMVPLEEYKQDCCWRDENRNLHNKFDHDDDPADGEIPVKPIELETELAKFIPISSILSTTYV